MEKQEVKQVILDEFKVIFYESLTDANKCEKNSGGMFMFYGEMSVMHHAGRRYA